MLQGHHVFAKSALSKRSNFIKAVGSSCNTFFPDALHIRQMPDVIAYHIILFVIIIVILSVLLSFITITITIFSRVLWALHFYLYTYNQ